MPDRPFALSIVPPSPPPAEDDYDAICATMMGSARGRWFLDEYARRNRNADTTLVLAAIERLEGTVRGEREQQSFQTFRAQLLDMAKTITTTRAEVAATAPPAQVSAEPHGPAAPPDDAQAASASPHVLAAAERIADVAWTMRERGFDPKTCDQIEALAASILTAPFLRQADDQRAQQLSEVLVYLERRVNSMIEACTAAPAISESQARAEPDRVESDLASPPEPHLELVSAGPVVLEADLPASQPLEATSDDTTVAAASADAAPISVESAASDAPALEAAAIDVPTPEAASAEVLLGPMPLPVGPALPTDIVSQPPQAADEAVGAPAQPVATPAPRLTTRDPLAFLKAMSPEERIALFT